MVLNKTNKWKILIPIIISILSLGFNVFQYLDGRAIQHKLDDIAYKRDSLQLEKDELALSIEYPSFQFSYFDMNYSTYYDLSTNSNDSGIDTALVENHPLLQSKYLENEVTTYTPEDGSIVESVMVLLIKQVGGSDAENIKITFDKVPANSQLGFTNHSDINTLAEGALNNETVTIDLGDLNSSESIVFPLFSYNFKDQSDAFDQNAIISDVFIAKSISFTTKNGKVRSQEIREMIDYPFSVTVSMDELG